MSPGVQSFTSDLEKFTRDHSKMKCYGLGLGLNTFKMVALTEHFRKLELPHLLNAYTRHAFLSLSLMWRHAGCLLKSTMHAVPQLASADGLTNFAGVQVSEAAVPVGLRWHAAPAVQHLHKAWQGGEYW